MSALEGRLEVIKQQLARNELERTSLLKAHKNLKDTRDELEKRATVKGRIQLYAENLPNLPSAQALEDAVIRLRREFDALNNELSDEQTQKRIDSRLSLINQALTAYGKMIKLEHSEEGVLCLDIKNLTVIADTFDQLIPMYEMGSGENWVGYHIVAHLALHDWFARRKRPVPGFLFLDQVSMTGCPSEVDGKGDSVILKSGKVDLDAYRRVFSLICTVVSQASQNLQVIMLEHMDLSDKDYQDAIVARWRGGEKLIPEDWYASGE